MGKPELISTALSWVGRDFNPGLSAQCAAFTSHCLDAAGFAWPHVVNKNWAPDLSGADNGKPIGKRLRFEELKAGDLVFFSNTYTVGTSTHVGIHVGEGKMVHRPTSSRPVEKADLAQGYWRDHFETGARPNFPPKLTLTTFSLERGKPSATHWGKSIPEVDVRVQMLPGGEVHVWRNGKEVKARNVALSLLEEP